MCEVWVGETIYDALQELIAIVRKGRRGVVASFSMRTFLAEVFSLFCR